MSVCIFRLNSYNCRVIKLIQIRYLLSLVLALMSVSCAAVEPSSVYSDNQMQGKNLSGQAAYDENPENWSERAREVLLNALSLTGIKYKYGGNTPETGFDCSGFVRYVFKQAASVTLPRSALEISQLGKSVSKNELQPGDLVFFNTVKTAFSHVGIYLGNNRFIHSPSSGGHVRVENMQEGYWAKRFNGAQRMEQPSTIKESRSSE